MIAAFLKNYHVSITRMNVQIGQEVNLKQREKETNTMKMQRRTSLTVLSRQKIPTSHPLFMAQFYNIQGRALRYGDERADKKRQADPQLHSKWPN